MYEVVIINDNKETVINAVSTDKDAPKITGTIKKESMLLIVLLLIFCLKIQVLIF